MTAVTARAPGGAMPAEFIPYTYGAALGRPSRGRPEKVLAHLKTRTEIWQEWYVPGADGREGRSTAKGSLPRPARNGLPVGGGYVYRGNRVGLSAYEAERALTGRAPAAPARTPRPRPPQRQSCGDCGQPKPDHLVTCRTVLDALPIAPPPGPEPTRLPEPAAETAPKRRTRRGAALTTTCPGCGRPKPDGYATCAGSGPCAVPKATPEPEPAPLPDPEPAALEAAPAVEPARRHRRCGYPVGSVGCKNTCGDS
jgi:hypothetical protein